ncbi:hypothetical protein ASF69_07720 [Rhizobium sp. Leaf311]|uniref:autotransporter domain-containing protein n=1 Tax=Rhizobium sp. Leaf311 TaxID=1736332 RepID=UPI0007144B93|nr:autotransporter domain-containing protein [Rhizobium sp. Leaf311]KQQ46074.1 hypothetical protein ASF69_07720 [Rhizobium sp. Leaf311]
MKTHKSETHGKDTPSRTDHAKARAEKAALAPSGHVGLRLVASPLAIAVFGSTLALPQTGLAADAAGGAVMTIYGGIGGAGNGHGGAGGDNNGSGTITNNTSSSSNGAGGNGGTSAVGAAGGSGGAAGSVATGPSIAVTSDITGGDGGDGTASVSYSSGGGGGGGAGLQAGSASITVSSGVNVSGGNGGDGGASHSGGGGGGGGGAALVSNIAGATIGNAGTLNGGDGGNGSSGYAGGGGGGGDGLLVAGSNTTVTNTGNITGGSGGPGGSSGTPDGSRAGYSGTGGAGIDLMGGNNTIINSGNISGGTGGLSSFSSMAGGVGIITYGDDTITNSGSISGGMSGNGATRANAILFNSTGNRLELLTGSAITGNIEFANSSGGTIAALSSGMNLSNAIVLGNASALTFDTSTGQGLEASGIISGSGTVAVNGGTSAIVFSANNSYTGTTAISSGATLQLGNGGTTGSLGTGNVVNDGTLVVNRSNTVSMNNNMSGTGNLTQAGTGTTVLRGNNSYTGTTTISSGTLQVGNGGTSGTLGNGDVVNNSALVINRSDSLTIGSSISGSGTLTQAGTGTTILTGGNSYAGTTTISSGTLQIGNGGATGTLGAGNLVNNSALVVNRSGRLTLGNSMSGNGTFTQSGTGTTVLTGNSAGYSGNIFIDSGVFQIDGIIGGNTTVRSGATLSGAGTVGSTVINSGGILSAGGNSAGTLTVDGTLQLDDGSSFLVDIAGNGTSDLVTATGDVSVDGTVVVTTLDSKSSYVSGQTYTILSSDTNLTGTFDGVTTSSSFLQLQLDYTATGVELIITKVGSFADVGYTPNQRATGQALETLTQSGSSLALYNKLLMLSDNEAASAFDMLSGEIHASLKTAILEYSSYVRDAMTARLRGARNDWDEGFWSSGYGAWGKTGGDSPNAARLQTSTGGLIIGGDASLPGDWRVGIAAAYGKSRDTLDDRASSADMDSYTVGTYAGTQAGKLALRMGLSNSWHTIDTSRNSSFSGFEENNRAAYDARATQAFGEAAYSITDGTTTYEPYVGLAYVNLHTDAYDENGTAGLHGERSNQQVIYSTLGARMDTPLQLGDKTGRLHAGLGWRHAEGDTTSSATHAFDGSDAFTVTGVPSAGDTALLEAGLNVPLRDDADFSLSYKGQFASHAWQNSVLANLRVRF